MSERRVLYVTAIGASANSFLKGHFRELNNHGFTVALACTHDKEADQATTETGIRHFPIGLSTTISPFRDCQALYRLLKVIRQYQPNVIHAHMSKAGLVGVLGGWLSRTPHRLYHNHGMAYFSSTGSRKLLLRAIEICACRCATEVVFCSQSTLDAAVLDKICPPNKARLIGAGTISGVDTGKFQPNNNAEDIALLRARFNIQADQKVVGFVGRIVAHKGIDTLLDAWSQLPTATARQRVLLICGKHDNDALYNRLISATRQHSNIRYVGRQDDIASIYPLLDVLTLPSWHEGFPYSVLEAQSSGVPAIVSRVTGNIDAVLHESTGIVVSPDNPKELSVAIAELLASDDRRLQYGRNARQRVLQYFSQRSVLSNLVEKYDALFHA